MPTVPNSNYTADNLPQGIDRADGLGGRLGTATQGLVVSTPDAGDTIENIPINELPDSPVIERAEQATITHVYTLSWTEGLTRLGIYGRGTLVRDSLNYYYRVLSSSLQRVRGDSAKLTIVCESISFDCPPDEFQINPVKLGIDILKHPRYFYALMPTNQIPEPWPSGLQPDTDEQIGAKQTIIRAIQAYRENPFIPQKSTVAAIEGVLHSTISAIIYNGAIVRSVPNPNFNPAVAPTEPDAIYGSSPAPYTNPGDPNPVYYYVPFSDTDDANGKVELAMAAAQEIIGKLWRMEDTPMINAVEIIHSEYWFRPPPLNLGGYRENPTKANPPLPDYFYSTAWPPDAKKTIFDKLASINPQSFSDLGYEGGTTTIDWLRDADTIEYQRTWFKVTRKWLGAPIGQWDAELYGYILPDKTNQPPFRPQWPDEYKTMVF